MNIPVLIVASIMGIVVIAALWDLGPAEAMIIKGLIALFFLWGLVWFVQVQWLKRPGAGILQLPHWIIWFLCAGLLTLGL
jgi:hypothetical protein